MIYIGIDLHRKRSHIAALDEQGTELLSRRVANDPEALRAILGELGAELRVALEATYGWEWPTDLLETVFRRGRLAQRGRPARGSNTSGDFERASSERLDLDQRGRPEPVHEAPVAFPARLPARGAHDDSASATSAARRAMAASSASASSFSLQRLVRLPAQRLARPT
jgi:Transposase